MPNIEFYQSLWAMERRQPNTPEWSLEQAFAMAAEAGYHGICIDMGGGDVPTVERAEPLFKQHNLGCTICAFPDSVEALKPVLDMAARLDARFININARYFPFTPAQGAAFVTDSLALCATAGIPAYFETHRLTLTNDLLYTLQLLELVPELDMVADLSHYVVGREMPFPVDDFHNDLIDRILRRSVAFQGRVASREQVQVQLDFPQHQAWVDQFFSWWEQGFRYWRARHDTNATLNFLCELGPTPYAITGPEGYELSDRWQEALLLKDRVAAIWAQF